METGKQVRRKEEKVESQYLYNISHAMMFFLATLAVGPAHKGASSKREEWQNEPGGKSVENGAGASNSSVKDIALITSQWPSGRGVFFWVSELRHQVSRIPFLRLIRLSFF